MKSPRAFTLIELLVVIAIIGLLSSVVLASLNTARERARDSRRMADLKQLQVALELYANSNNGRYPDSDLDWHGTTPGCYGTGSNPNTAIPGLAPTHIPALPEDPEPNLPYYCYLYRSDGVNYMLLAYGTVETLVGSANPMPRPRYPSQASFSVYTPGARNW